MNLIRTAEPLTLRTFIQIRRWSHQPHGQKSFVFVVDSQDLLSEKNSQRCLRNMTTSEPIKIISKGSVREKSFAAVLIAICTDENNDNPSLLYTKRSRTLRRHMSQISFPGGIKDSEEDYIQCALRETEEEIGLSRNRVDVWGTGGLVTPPHTAAIMPVIGVVKNFRTTELQLNPSEVEEAFTVPIEFLAKASTLRYTQFKSGYSAPVFIVGTRRIWGITGFLTNLFLNALLPTKMNVLKGRVKYIKPFKANVHH